MRLIYSFLIFCLVSGITYSQNILPGLQYIYPKTDSKQVNPDASLILGFDIALTPEQISSLNIDIRTEKNKRYNYKVIPAEQNKTLVVKHSELFLPGETIIVSFNTDNVSSDINTFRFHVTENTWNEELRKPLYEEKTVKFKTLSNRAEVEVNEEPLIINGVAVPSDFPVFEATTAGETASGYLFLSNWTGSPYLLILENDGTPVFYRNVEDRSIDFKVQPTGELSYFMYGTFNGYISLDSNYYPVDTFKCQNGYATDEHELLLLENGHAVMIAQESRTIDMSVLVTGGQTDATVLGTHVQEIDENDNVVFEFNCFDNFDITGATEEDLTANSIDYVHMNSIAVDYDSNYVISSRNLSECTKINRETGEIMWRLGGTYNDFTFIDESVMPDYQHDIRPVPGKPGNYTIFDNGNHRGYSRVVEYQLDTTAKTATKVWEYRPDPDKLNTSMGSAQRLPNGNTLINWADASLPKATEVDSLGNTVYEGNFVENSSSYRTLRQEWDGYLEEPMLMIEQLPDKVRLIFNKFGDTTVTTYRIYGGTTISSEELLDSTSNTWIELTDLDSNQVYHFKVTAVNNVGIESGFSNQDSVFVRYPTPGDNLVRNGDFSDDVNYWDFYLYGAVATGSVNAGEQYEFDISDGSTFTVGVQLRQIGVPLFQGYDYIFEFDAMAASARSIEAKVGMDVSPYTNYSGIGLTNITDEMQHYSYEFTMDDPTDLNCRVVINCGNDNNNVTIDNIALYIKEPDIEPEQVQNISGGISSFDVFPNPVSEQLTVKYNLLQSGNVILRLYDVSGKMVYSSEQKRSEDNAGMIEIDMRELEAGTYICSFEFQPDNDNKTIVNQKIIKTEQ